MKAVTAEVRLGDKRVALAVPTTYMNESGAAVAPLVRRFGIEDPARLVVVHDELDLEPGRLKIKLGAARPATTGCARSSRTSTRSPSPASASASASPLAQPGAEHVLKRPGKAERELLATAIEEAADAVELLVAEAQKWP